MVNPTDHLDQALAKLWANTRPKATDVLVRNLRAHAYSYAMDDAALCEVTLWAADWIQNYDESGRYE
jgi:hypothetical protein